MSSIVLGGLISLGTEGQHIIFVEPGTITPSTLSGSCGGGVCTTGIAKVGNMVAAPLTVTSPALCLVTRTTDAGNGSPELGSLNLTNGEQHTTAPIAIDFYGKVCPVCDNVTKLCASGAHKASKCTKPGETDIACPPDTPLVTTLLIPAVLSTEPSVLTIPSGAGVNNPNNSFCGSCNDKPSVACTNDSDCMNANACTGNVAADCCQFNAKRGAFGDTTVTAIPTEGVRGPFLPQLAGVFCAGKSGNDAIDMAIGMPGPVRLQRAHLNAFDF